MERVLEKHVQTILVILVSAAICFVASTMYLNSKTTAEFSVKIETMTKQLEALDKKVEWMNASYVRRDEFKDLDARVRDIEIGVPRATRKQK